MKIGFLIIASEVLDGKITDLNTKILADFLKQYDFEINQSITVRDDQDAIKKALNELFKNNELLITSGGLGPTKDDITKESLGSFFNRPMAFNPDAQKVAEDNYQRMNRTFPGPSHGYSYLPEQFHPLSNPVGFAPAFYTKENGKIILSAPGVPREFRGILESHFLHLISQKTNHHLLHHFIIRTKNIPEEKIFGEVDPNLWQALEQFGEVSSLPIMMGVDIGVKIKGRSPEDLEFKIKKLTELIEKSPLSPNIWSFGPTSLEEKIITTANLKGIRIGLAESATGGLCSHRLTNIPGSSQCLMGSVVCYTNEIKESVLGVKKETLNNFSAVSAETATEMALGLFSNFKLDIAISITGVAGPGGGSERTPVGSVYIGRMVKGKKTSAEYFQISGDRELVKQRFSQLALYALLEELEKLN